MLISHSLQDPMWFDSYLTIQSHIVPPSPSTVQPATVISRLPRFLPTTGPLHILFSDYNAIPSPCNLINIQPYSGNLTFTGLYSINEEPLLHQ